jgi:alpha-amylase/alpha-mannosidase (GH57 family)
MSHPLYVAFIWHQHQPFYKTQLQAHYQMPWVRLHGTKDYLDLILLLERYPSLRQTVNLVPSLILQLEDYGAGTAFDPYLTLTLTAAEQLSLDQRQFVVERFFDAHHQTLIDPHPRYAELYGQRQDKGQTWCLEHWQANDYGDLMAWHNLTWIDPLFWDDPEIAGWLKQGKNFSLSDRQRIYSKQRQIISRILPQHRQMQDRGQIEITTTPYSHPILPLLADTDAAQVALPQAPLPQQRFHWPQDIPRQLQKARQIYRQRFGCQPRGLWPSEQAVSPAILPDVAAAGFNWLCSDETVLGRSLGQVFHRDATGTVQEPERLYRPYRLETPQGDLAMVFRDHRISDLIGFSYGAMEPRRAAIDLVGQLEAIARSLKVRQTHPTAALEDPWLVTIALDGENCWEFYPQDGKPFLEKLYQIFSEHPMLQLVTVSEFLDRFPPRQTLPAAQLHSGSWVDGSFSTWIGEAAKNRAWDLAQARQVLARHPEATEETNPDAWEALYAAEGSDWCWWFGGSHPPHQEILFDQLYREHLASLYRALNEPVPPELRQPLIDRSQPSASSLLEVASASAPLRLIHPSIDGQGDEQDWQQAGRLEVGAQGSMRRNSPIQRLWYGVNHLNLFLRLDFSQDYCARILSQSDLPPELHLLWFYPDRPLPISSAPLADLPDQAPLNYRFRHHLGIDLHSQTVWFQEASDGIWQSRLSRTQVAFQTCLELALPWADLPGVEPDWTLRLLAVLAEEGRYVAGSETDLVTVLVP